MAKIKPQALLQQSKKKKGPSRISVINIVIYSLVLLLIGFFLFAAYRRWSQRSEIPAGHNARSVLEDTTFQEIKKGDLPRYVTLDTGKGSVTVELFKDISPDVVDQFVKLCQDGYFKGIPFPRIIKNDSSLENEVFMFGTPKAKNEQGIFEIFIITSSNSELKEKLIVFGRVTKGHHVIKEMDEEKNHEANRSIEIMDVTLHQYI